MRSDCPISYALDFFGDKWTFLIIRDLVFEGKRFYSEFLNSKEKIATNILSDRLKKLEQNGVIESKVYEKLKTKKEYSLTEKGKHLIPVLVEMILWSARYDDSLAVPQVFIEQAKMDKEGMIARITARIQ
ncbi:MAG: helix-turn-helix transcriptional regulator [Saprospiraceae bacterium]|nr:helix-turn-helix transcriptional regulator [Saprospiraceae bacterium]